MKGENRDRKESVHNSFQSSSDFELLWYHYKMIGPNGKNYKKKYVYLKQISTLKCDPPMPVP